MNEINALSAERYGYDFIPAAFLPPGKDEYWQRNIQHDGLKNYRHLTSEEIEILTQNANHCPDWNDFFVTDPFEPHLIRGSAFYGLVRLGILRRTLLKHHDFCVPAGIRNSTIISCDIGDDCAVQDCSYISHYIIGDNCILSRIDEMQTTNHAKFGSGAVMDGEEENVRVWIEVMNEAGGRAVLPFAEMISADAFLWAAYRDDTGLTEKLKEITQRQYGGSRGRYGTVGDRAVIKSCRIIKDAAIGSRAYIKGANKLKNITIHSSVEEPSQIGEGVEMVNGIAGYGCHVFYGAKAVRFVIGRNSSLKYGARLIHSVLGDNSTVSCCEILNNLIFPVHEQHHNNSFLIAGLIQGQSNIAAAATIGSNHNSRANDGEIRAGRGFWPGLAVTLKHSSCFASYVIIAKGDYPCELNIPLPFSLVNNNEHKNRLEILPAYFWLYNLYALERNSWKSKNRDKRKIKIQHIETDYLAPDTAEEIITAIDLLETWIGEIGSHDGDDIKIIAARNLEKSGRDQVILKPLKAVKAYRRMLRYYAAKTLAAFLASRPGLNYGGLLDLFGTHSFAGRIDKWVNFGGQIVPAFRVDRLREQIRSGEIQTWEEIHGIYNSWLDEYPTDSAFHAWSVLALFNISGPEDFKREITEAKKIRKWISEQVLETREKDFKSGFKKMTFRNKAEMEQVVGSAKTGAFIEITKEEEIRFIKMIESIETKL